VRGIARRRREVVVTAHGEAIVWMGRHFSGVMAFALERGAYRSRGEPGKCAAPTQAESRDRLSVGRR